MVGWSDGGGVEVVFKPEFTYVFLFFCFCPRFACVTVVLEVKVEEREKKENGTRAGMCEYRNAKVTCRKMTLIKENEINH